MPTIDEYLEAKRRGLGRVEPQHLADEVSAGAIVVDIRPAANRATEGAMPGALVIDATVLLWRLSPSSDAKSVDVGPGQKVIVFCNEGYASSIAAAELREVGVDAATDLVGGYRAWALLGSEGPDTVGDETSGGS